MVTRFITAAGLLFAAAGAAAAPLVLPESSGYALLLGVGILALVALRRRAS